jgi:hypothetical protein
VGFVGNLALARRGNSMTIQAGNLFADVADVSAANIEKEAFSEILARRGLKIERIVSQGQTKAVSARFESEGFPNG